MHSQRVHSRWMTSAQSTQVLPLNLKAVITAAHGVAMMKDKKLIPYGRESRHYLAHRDSYIGSEITSVLEVTDFIIFFPSVPLYCKLKEKHTPRHIGRCQMHPTAVSFSAMHQNTFSEQFGYICQTSRLGALPFNLVFLSSRQCWNIKMHVHMLRFFFFTQYNWAK